LLAAILAALVMAAFHAVGGAYYEGFRVRQGFGMEFPIPGELSYYFLFFVFGLALLGLLTVALLGTRVPTAARRALRAMASRPVMTALAAAALATAGAWWVGTGVLGGGVLSDDEPVYSFIAQTLRTGSLTAPSPRTDLEFFEEQFVVLTDTVRYGQYPIGHPLLVALGQAVGAERAVVPILNGVAALFLAWVARRAFSSVVAALAVTLFVLSPEALLTGGSLLSQPASAVCLMGAVGCLCELAAEDGPRRSAWAVGAGAFLAYGIVTRPLPGVLFAATIVLAFAFWRRIGFAASPAPGLWLALLVPLACGPAALLWVNYRQSGHALVSGYHVRYGAEWGQALVFHGTLARWAMSFVTSVTRINFWLFGWPLSLAFCPLARRTPVTRLLWGLVAAELAYRVAAPKGGIGTSGAIYFYEIVPVLCLLSADGMVELARRGEKGWPLQRLGAPGTVLAAAGLSGVLVSLSLFLPFKLADVARCGQGEKVIVRLLQEKNVHRALVFHRGIVPPWTGLSWAYFPAPNGPRLDDDVLFVTLQLGTEGLARNLDFWKRRFPDREAWVFGWTEANGPFLVPLPTYAQALTGGAVPDR
jgi:hypothetical protein